MSTLNWLIDWLKNSQEVRAFGLNWPTFVATGATFFTFLQAWSVIKQRQKIIEEKSLKSVDVSMFVYLGFYFLMFAYYGVHKSGLTMVVNGMQGFLYIPLFFTFAKYGTSETLPKNVWVFGLVCSLLVPAMVSVKNKELFLLISLFGILFFLAKQARKIWIANDMGSVDAKYIVVFLLTCTFWLGYATATKEWVLQIFNSCAVIIFFFMLKPLFVGRAQSPSS